MPGTGAFPVRASRAEGALLGELVAGPEGHRTGPLDPTLVESARGAVSASLPIRFPGPLTELGVRVSTYRALHRCCRQAVVGSAQCVGIARR